MKKFLVIGNPLKHSLSPKLHGFWIKKNNIKATFEKKEINENEIENLISKIKEDKICGMSVTKPFKNSVIPFLDQLTPLAHKLQSVNTIYKENKKIVGHNTDIGGFELSVKKINTYVRNIYEENGKILTHKHGYPQFYTQILFEKGKQEIFMKTVLNDEEGISKISNCKKIEKFKEES